MLLTLVLLVDCVHADRLDSMLDHTWVQRENSVPAESATDERFSIPLELRGIADDRRPMERRACLAVMQGMIIWFGGLANEFEKDEAYSVLLYRCLKLVIVMGFGLRCMQILEGGRAKSGNT